MHSVRWVLLAYRLPREPSTPRISVWRQLRRLGVAHLADGVVALPLDARTREQLEWLAEDVVDHGGQATIWLAETGTAAQERALAQQMTDGVDAAYARLLESVSATAFEPESVRRRTIPRLRRDLARIRARDFFPTPLANRAQASVEALARSLEAAS